MFIFIGLITLIYSLQEVIYTGNLWWLAAILFSFWIMAWEAIP